MKEIEDAAPTKNQQRRNAAVAVAWLPALALALMATTGAAQTAPALPELIEVNEAELQTDTGAQLAAAMAAYRDQLGENDTAALESAKEIIALSVDLWGDDDPRIAMALTNLAITQVSLGNHETARDNFMSAIRVAEVASNSLIAPGLVNPLRGLATSLLALDSPELAIPIFERAIHVSHVNEGPNNLEQLPIMEALGRAYYFMGELREANTILDNILRVQQRRFDENSDAYIDAMVRRARWYTRTRHFDDASNLYRRVERRLTDTHGADDIRLVQPLLELGFVAPQQIEGNINIQAIGQEGRRAVNRAVRIARLHSEDNPRLLARTLVRQGDWHMTTRGTRSARLPYREAWELMNSDPSLHDLRDSMFGEPIPVTLVEIDRIFGYSANQDIVAGDVYTERGFVEVRYNISSTGKPFGLELIDSEPPGMMEPHVIRQLRRFIYRPAFENGDPVVYRDMVYRHEFRYNQRELTDRAKDFVERMRRERAEEAPLPESDDAADTAAPGSDGESDRAPSAPGRDR